MNLKALPPNHPLRNAPLSEIGARYRHEESKFWRKVLPSFGIAKSSFNDLGEVWTDGTEWECER